MKKLAKLVVVLVFVLSGLFVLLSSGDPLERGLAQARPTPTPAPAANTAPAATPKPAAAGTPTAGGGASIRETFTLGADSKNEKYPSVPFNHRTHAEMKYSPDGNSVVACVECHHTDQPASALKPPLLTSERNEILTMEVYRKSSQKVSTCRSCHFQDGDVPDGKEMPTAEYTERGKKVTKDLNNELAYHINCNTCHDAAFKA